MIKIRLLKRTAITMALLVASTFLALAQSTKVHTVKHGETLESIAKKYSVKKEDILNINQEASKDLYPGMELFIPNKSSSSSNYGNVAYSDDSQGGQSVDNDRSNKTSNEVNETRYQQFVGQGFETHTGFGKFSNESQGSSDYTPFGVGFSTSALFSEHSPFFVDAGLNLIYTKSKEEEHGVKTTFTMISSTIPLNVGYIIAIPNTKVAFCPFVGLSGKFHYYGKIKTEYKGESESSNVFSESDMGKDNKYNNMQLAWQAGLKFCIRGTNTAFLRLSYGEDITELAKKIKMKQFTMAIGCYF